MPLPLFLGIAAGIAAAGGIGTGVHGAVKMKKANDTVKSAGERHKKNVARFESCNTRTATSMDNLGKLEIDILASFQQFSDIFERIQNRPDFKDLVCESVELPRYDKEEIAKVSVGAGVLMGGISGAALGTAGGFAAAGATTAAVMALGTASTGTAIATLSGAAATNATLAALGGGALAAGGGGIALGTTMLGVTTLGVGLLVGGVIFSITGSSLSNKAQKSWDEMLEAEKEINKICAYLNSLDRTAKRYTKTIKTVNDIYRRHLNALDAIVNINGKVDWNDFTEQERLVTMNTVLLVQLLYKMCQVTIVLKAENDKELNKVNTAGVDENIVTANKLLEERELVDAQKTDAASEWKYNKNESYCIATAALLYYFARCDGTISDEEREAISEIIQPLIQKKTVSENAMAEIDDIRKTVPFSFIHLRHYLSHISLSELTELSKFVEQVIEASDGITDAETSAQIDFENYLAYRKISK